MRNPRYEVSLAMRQMGIEAQQERIVHIHRDCYVCRSEGFEAQTRVLVSLNRRLTTATLNVVGPALLELGEAALSNSAWQALAPAPDNRITVSHTPALDSMSQVRARTYNHRLDTSALDSIISDIVAGSYPRTHIATSLSACAGGRMDLRGMIDLTRAMLATDKRLDWGHAPIADKHCVDGLPGSRMAPIVVPIITVIGPTIPETSSKAITSPTGTANVIGTMTPAVLDLEQMRRVAQHEGGYFVWGGSLALSPADDMLIHIEHPLDLDNDAQLVAFVLSKRIATDTTHFVINIPARPIAKARSDTNYECLKQMLEQVAQAFDLRLQVVRTGGTQPVGRGIGPSLETHDVLTVPQHVERASEDLNVRVVVLAGRLLKLYGHSELGTDVLVTRRLLDNGATWAKFQAVCKAQEGLREPQRARLREPVLAERDGTIREIDSRRLACVTRLTGASKVPVTGLELYAKLRDRAE